MINDELNLIFKGKSIEYAKNQKIYLDVLSGLVLTYTNFCNIFMDENHYKILNFFKKDENTKNILEDLERENLLKLLSFLNSGQNLINKETKKIIESEFGKYITLDKANDSKKWNEFVKYAENELKLKNISALNYNLQFIVGFFKSKFIRQEYFYKVLIQIWKEKSKDENLFKKLFEDENFGPNLEENVQLEKTVQIQKIISF